MAAAQALGAGSARPAMAAAPGETPLLQVHAEGAQIYECKADAEGGLAWVLREPIASLFLDGKTVGHHYAGPRWEFSDGSSVSGKVVGKSPGDGPADIHWLKLAASGDEVEGWSPASRRFSASIRTAAPSTEIARPRARFGAWPTRRITCS